MDNNNNSNNLNNDNNYKNNVVYDRDKKIVNEEINLNILHNFNTSEKPKEYDKKNDFYNYSKEEEKPKEEVVYVDTTSKPKYNYKNIVLIIFLLLAIIIVLFLMLKDNKKEENNNNINPVVLDEKSCFDNQEISINKLELNKAKICISKNGAVYLRIGEEYFLSGVTPSYTINDIKEYIVSNKDYLLPFNTQIKSISKYRDNDSDDNLLLVITQNGDFYLIDEADLITKGIVTVKTTYHLTEKAVSANVSISSSIYNTNIKTMNNSYIIKENGDIIDNNNGIISKNIKSTNNAQFDTCSTSNKIVISNDLYCNNKGSLLVAKNYYVNETPDIIRINKDKKIDLYFVYKNEYVLYIKDYGIIYNNTFNNKDTTSSDGVSYETLEDIYNIYKTTDDTEIKYVITTTDNKKIYLLNDSTFVKEEDYKK